jgi:acyl carrier protein
MDDRLYQQTKTLICAVLEIPETDLADQTHFIDDLGVDSILIIELKTKFEEHYRCQIDKSDLDQLTSLGAIIGYLQNRNISAV